MTATAGLNTACVHNGIFDFHAYRILSGCSVTVSNMDKRLLGSSSSVLSGRELCRCPLLERRVEDREMGVIGEDNSLGEDKDRAILDNVAALELRRNVPCVLVSGYSRTLTLAPLEACGVDRLVAAF